MDTTSQVILSQARTAAFTMDTTSNMILSQARTAAFTMNTTSHVIMSQARTTAFNQTTHPTDTDVLDARAWVSILYRCMAPLTIAGFLANVISFVALQKNPRGFSPVTCFIFKFQTLIDALACLICTLSLQTPRVWYTGVTWLDTVICHVWHTRALYWWCVLVSIWNLVFIAYDRYNCVYRVFTYDKHNLRQLVCQYVTLAVSSPVLVCVDFVVMRMKEGQCVEEMPFSQEVNRDVLACFAISTYFTFFLIPTAAQVALYALVVHRLRQQSKHMQVINSTQPTCRTARDITITGFLVCAIFVICIGFDLTCFVLRANNVNIDFSLGSPLQIAGILMVTLNNAINPLVYALLIVNYRQNVVKTFCTGCKTPSDKQGNYTISYSNKAQTVSVVCLVESEN